LRDAQARAARQPAHFELKKLGLAPADSAFHRDFRGRAHATPRYLRRILVLTRRTLSGLLPFPESSVSFASWSTQARS
jgi:hypothetical protein